MAKKEGQIHEKECYGVVFVRGKCPHRGRANQELTFYARSDLLECLSAEPPISSEFSPRLVRILNPILNPGRAPGSSLLVHGLFSRACLTLNTPCWFS